MKVGISGRDSQHLHFQASLVQYFCKIQDTGPIHGHIISSNPYLVYRSLPSTPTLSWDLPLIKHNICLVICQSVSRRKLSWIKVDRPLVVIFPPYPAARVPDHTNIMPPVARRAQMAKNAIGVVAEWRCDGRVGFHLTISNGEWWSLDYVFIHVESVEREIDGRVDFTSRLSLGSTEALEVDH